jgi:hypothetical protein
MDAREDEAHHNAMEKLRNTEEDHRALTKGAVKLIKTAEEEIATSKKLVAAAQEAVRLTRQLLTQMKAA